MQMSENVEILTAIFPNLVSIAVMAYLAFKVHSAPMSHKKSMFWMFLSVGVLSGIWMAERFADTVELSLLLVSIEYIVTSFLVITTFFFVLRYLGMDSWLTRSRKYILGMIAALLVLSMLSNPLHHQFYISTELLHQGGLYFLRADYGPLFFILLAYYSVLMGACMLLLNRAVIQSPPSRKKGPLVVLVSIIIIMATFYLYISSPRDNPYVDMLSLGIALAAFALFIGERSTSFIGAEIITVQDAIESNNDGIIILSRELEPIYMNRQAQLVLDNMENQSLFQSITSHRTINREEVYFHMDEGRRCFEVAFCPIQKGDTETGTMVSLHDISARKRAEMELRLSKERNQTLSRIIEHDIKNEMAAILGYLELAGDTQDYIKGKNHLSKAEERAWAVMRHLDFAHAYRMIGAEEPKFQCLKNVIDEAFSQLDLQGLKTVIDVGNVRIFADPMLYKVFYNLAQNTLKHAEGATRISLSIRFEEDRCLVDYRDDGPGIPVEQKERIFLAGSGKGSRHGMMIVREILHMTDISIREIGEGGAHFVIEVPTGGWRRGTDAA